MKPPVTTGVLCMALCVLLYAVSGPHGERQQRRLAEDEAEGRYDFEPTIVSPIQQKLKEQYQEALEAAETGIPTSISTLEPSASPLEAAETGIPTSISTLEPSASSLEAAETGIPTSISTLEPSASPLEAAETGIPTSIPTLEPSAPAETDIPTPIPTLEPSASPGPSGNPSGFPSLIPSELESALPSFLPSGMPSEQVENALAEVLAPSLIPSASPGPSDVPSLTPSLAPSDVTFLLTSLGRGGEEIPRQCVLGWIDFVRCSISCEGCDLDSELVAGQSCDELEDWRGVYNTDCCGSNHCDELLAAFMVCNGCENESELQTPSPSQSPSKVSEGEEQFPTLAPSSSIGPSVLPSLFLSETINNVPSSVPSQVPRDEVETVGAAENFPTLGPSESPSLTPSEVGSGVPSSFPSQSPSNGIETTVEDLPTLGPSESPRPSSGSDLPSLSPSDLLSTMKIDEELAAGDDPIDGDKNATITCDLDATIECETSDGEACSFSRIPTEDIMCQDSPTQLMWLYKGGHCSNSTDETSFMCEDLVEGGLDSASTVLIEIHGEEVDEIYYRETARRSVTGSLDSVIVLNRSFSIPMENIFVHIKSNDQDGELLQILAIPNICHQSDGKVIGNMYGALQFAGYATEDKTVKGFRHLEWTFAVTSEQGHELTLKSATAVVNGETKTFISGESLIPRQEASFFCYETISLWEPKKFSGAVTVVAEGKDGMECAATAASFIEI